MVIIFGDIWTSLLLIYLLMGLLLVAEYKDSRGNTTLGTFADEYVAIKI